MRKFTGKINHKDFVNQEFRNIEIQSKIFTNNTSYEFSAETSFR